MMYRVSFLTSAVPYADDDVRDIVTFALKTAGGGMTVVPGSFEINAEPELEQSLTEWESSPPNLRGL